MSKRKFNYHNRVPYTVITNAMESLGITKSVDMAQMLNVAPSTLNTWSRAGSCPAWVPVAIDGFLATNPETPMEQVMLIRTPPHQTEALKIVLQAMNIEFSTV